MILDLTSERLSANEEKPDAVPQLRVDNPMFVGRAPMARTHQIRNSIRQNRDYLDRVADQDFQAALHRNPRL